MELGGQQSIASNGYRIVRAILSFYDVNVNLRGRFTSNPGDSFSIRFNVSLPALEDILSTTVSLTWEA